MLDQDAISVRQCCGGGGPPFGAPIILGLKTPFHRDLLSMIRLMTLALVLASAATSSGGQFNNLGFEEADVSKVSPTLQDGLTPSLIPFWGLSYGIAPVNSLGYNLLPVGFGAFATLLDAKASTGLFAFPVDGQFAFAAFAPKEGNRFVLKQIGDVPLGATYLSLKFSVNPFLPAANGAPLGFVRTTSSNLGTYALFDISQYTGRQIELSLTSPGVSVLFGELRQNELTAYLSSSDCKKVALLRCYSLGFRFSASEK